VRAALSRLREMLIAELEQRATKPHIAKRATKPETKQPDAFPDIPEFLCRRPS